MKLRPGLERKLRESPQMQRALRMTAQRISDDARRRTPVDTGRAARSHRVEVDGGRVYAAAGGGDAWHYVFVEFGGSGLRPPLAPLRRAAEVLNTGRVLPSGRFAIGRD